MARAPSPRVLAALRALGRPYICRNCQRAKKQASVFRPSCAPSSRTFLSDASQNLYNRASKRRKEHINGGPEPAQNESSTPLFSETAKKRARLEEWELTVGIEIHAELNTRCKLFSPAETSLADTPNAHVASFDAALPGAQPQFQQETLLPAIRAALALDCQVQRRSSWDRKHYFWWDQPNGYQITQYYEPFAKNGKITLYEEDDIDRSDRPHITIGIKQIQMEQDTAKTTLQPPMTNLIDFNRVSHPLIEIITLPQIHSPKTAAAVVKKIQSILKAVDANTTGMEMGGLRADVNVSVRHRDRTKQTSSGLSYAGVTGLGQRTEIKNLNSFKAVEDAIVAERDRQIDILEAGGVIEGETRGWTLGATETHRIRGKEGEVDYRYMPDPDLPPLIIGEDLIDHLHATLPALPDDTVTQLHNDPLYGLTIKDAKTLIALDDGDRLEYYLTVVHMTRSRLASTHPTPANSIFTASRTPAAADATTPDLAELQRRVGLKASNMLLHELGALLATSADPSWPANKVTPSHMAQILTLRIRNHITTATAKQLLWLASNGSFDANSGLSAVEREQLEAQAISRHVHEKNLRIKPMDDREYLALALQLVGERPDIADGARKELAVAAEETRKLPSSSSSSSFSQDGAKSRGKKKAATGKVKWFVGQMLHRGDSARMAPDLAERAVRTAIVQTA